ncbi:hypothetical protein CIRG_04696 [Coccidioides immitis RMSCC 2394]|uniref:Uncharacterized protein n=1 Tax=Coccidioides immitis RMSCC 2394 TaxID=404692 RepID=A0A0J6YBB8_COCIT|nr:hypothetical protein CIRG_04696 [Coccidioides immitis RMSCC 2394]
MFSLTHAAGSSSTTTTTKLQPGAYIYTGLGRRRGIKAHRRTLSRRGEHRISTTILIARREGFTWCILHAVRRETRASIGPEQCSSSSFEAD